MLFFPQKRETIILPYDAGEVERQLNLFVKPVKVYGTPVIDKKPGEYFFNGYVHNRHFQFSKVIKIPQNFLPLISGHIEDTSRGCILFVKYRLFNSTILFLSLWIIICMFMAVVFAFIVGKIFYGIIAVLFAIINYVVAVKNFSLQFKRSKKDFDVLLRGLNNNTNV